MKRVFFALELPPAQRALVEAAVQPLRERFAARWVRDESWHLTLVFLGDTAEEQLPALISRVAAIAAGHAPLTLALRGAGTFGGASPRVLWLGVDGELDAARALQAQLQTALEVKDAHEGWTPHLTLARAKPSRGDPCLLEAALALGQFSTAGFTVGAVTLFESRGGRYEVLAQAPLSRRPQPV